MEEISVRGFLVGDTEATAQIYFDAVRLGTHDHYTENQRQAWAPRVPDGLEWRDRLTNQTTLVAECDDRVVGFMTLNDDGHIDLAFVAPAFIGKGVAKRLYDVILTEAVARGLSRLHTEASLLARPFFERQGWSVVKQQSVHTRGVFLTNFVMEKQLGA